MFGSITVPPDRDMDEDFWEFFLDNLDLLIELIDHPEMAFTSFFYL